MGIIGKFLKNHMLGHRDKTTFSMSVTPFIPSRYMHFCGGSAITTTHILTAAHCVDVGIRVVPDDVLIQCTNILDFPY